MKHIPEHAILWIEENIATIIPYFKDYFGEEPVSKEIPTIAWMFFLNEYLMGYAVHGNDFEAFIKEVEAMKR